MTTQSLFDVFLCHNSEDKEAVITIAEQLKYEHKIEPWLDEWELRPGFPWQPELEKQIAHIKSAAVFVGKSGIGPWQSREIYGFLSEFQERQCPVIPVLLPDAPHKPQLPIFLRGMTWVDFRQQTRVYTPPMDKLVWGITGEKKRQPIVEVIPPQSKTKHSNQTDDSDDDLSSEKGVDYRKLRDLLAAGKWKEADYETYLMMLQAVGRKENDWITEEELLNFPCTDLRTIDQLWVKYSNGRFGFSVQKKIYLDVGGKPDGKYYQEAWKKFGDRVGWRVKQNWISYDEVNFDTSALVGHLPSWVAGRWVGVVVVGFVGFFLFSRIETCKL
ncbi:TIR domain-containing protein [Tolypothrix campylonemoides VB511288]|nr:TIR domain-containing protein [Tolypothrix campylonemoides VB511288]